MNWCVDAFAPAHLALTGSLRESPERLPKPPGSCEPCSVLCRYFSNFVQFPTDAWGVCVGDGIVTLPHVSSGQYLAWFRKASRPSLACRLLNLFRKIAWKLRDCYGGAVAVRTPISKLRAQIKRIGLPHEAMPPRKRSGSLAGRRRGPGTSPQLSLEPKGKADPLRAPTKNL